MKRTNHIGWSVAPGSTSCDHGAIQDVPTEIHLVSTSETGRILPGRRFDGCIIAIDTEELGVVQGQSVIDVLDKNGAS